jgi:mono/diheme cytochrome c family protein
MRKLWTALAAFGIAAVLSGCRGSISTDTPFKVQINMVQQWRTDFQEPNPFFADKRGMRPGVPGTVVSGSLQATDEEQLHLHEGIKAELYSDAYPAAVQAEFGLVDGKINEKLLKRGEERFAIYCAPCHSPTGRGEGIIVQRGYPPPQSFLEPRLRAYPLGRIVNVLLHGKNNMPSYSDQVPVADRWAVASYVRALQIAGAAPAELAPNAKPAAAEGK